MTALIDILPPCTQCGHSFRERACGPTHAIVSANPERHIIVAPIIAKAETRGAAEAWDQGYTSGHSNAMRRMSDEPIAPTTPNPYRTEATSREVCSTDGCTGDARYAAPGRGHVEGCRYPRGSAR